MKLLIELNEECVKVIDKIKFLVGGRADRKLQLEVIKAIKNCVPLEQEPRWIPVSEKLPKDLEPVNITWVNHKPAPYYNDIKDKPFTATGVYFNGQWYWWSTTCTDILAEYSHNYDDIIDDAIEVTAWMPMPESYKGKSEVKN